MGYFLLNLKQALRALRHAPGFACAAILTLALGIGANTAMFSAINTLLLRPLPFRQPERLVHFTEVRPGQTLGRFSGPNFCDYRARATRFEAMAAYRNDTEELTGWGTPRSLEVGRVTAGFFEVLGLQPVLGSFLKADHELPGQGRVAVLSFAMWRRQFGGDQGVVGQTLYLGGEPYAIIGVAPAAAALPLDGPQELYLPIAQDPTGDSRGSHSLNAVGRLKSGVGLGEAEGELKAIAAALAAQYPATNGGYTAALRDLHAAMVGDSRTALLLLMGAVILLLLVACTNVASLFLARAASRRHEVAVRASLGATRNQLLAQYLAEGLVVALAGAGVGLLIAKGILVGLPGFLPKVRGMDPGAIGLDGGTLAFTLAVSLLTGVLFGITPALQARQLDLQSMLRTGGRGASARSAGTRAIFVVGQVAMAVLLLLGSGLLLRSFLKVLRTSPGFDHHQVVTFSLNFPEARYKTDAQVATFHRELVRRLGALPGVQAAGMAVMSPMGRGRMGTTFHEGATSELRSTWPTSSIELVDGGYFRTLRVPVLEGRAFDDADAEAGKRVMVVNQAFARLHFPGRSPLGARLLAGIATDTSPDGTLWEIVGVVGDIRNAGLERAPEPKFYLPAAQLPYPFASPVLRTSASALAMEGAIREQVAALDSSLAVTKIQTLEEKVRVLMGDRTQVLVLMGAFAALALVLAGIGIYGLLAFSVAQRGREMGIRMALGCQAQQILTLVLGEGFRLVGVGVAVGLLAFLGSGRVLAHQLFGLGVLDPFTLMAVPFLLGLVALLACLAPTLRAIRVDPVVALRND